MTESDVATFLLDQARALASEAPGKMVNVTLATCVWHTPAFVPSNTESANWGVSVGHGETVTAPTLTEALAKWRHAGSPEARREKAAQLRREADALEAAISP